MVSYVHSKREGLQLLHKHNILILASYRKQLGRKPYNPILAETHLCWVDHKNREGLSGVTKFFGEQVCHHPPVTAFIVENSTEKLKVKSNVTFSTLYNYPQILTYRTGTAFHGNSVTAMPSGPTEVEFGNHNEVYKLNPGMPNVGIKNVIIGTRRHVWEGTVTITCEASGYQATLNYFEEGWYCINTASGYITTIKEPNNKLYTIVGSLSDVVTLTNTKTNKAEVSHHKRKF